MVRLGGGLPAVPAAAPVARGVSVSPVPGRAGVDEEPRPGLVPAVQSPDLGHRRDPLPRHPDAPAPVVPGHVVRHEPEAGGERGGPAAGAWGRGATTRRGPGCTSCAGPWCARGAIGWPGRSRWMRSTGGGATSPGRAGAGRPARPSSARPPRGTAPASAGTGCGAPPTPRPGAWARRSRGRSRRGVRCAPTPGRATRACRRRETCTAWRGRRRPWGENLLPLVKRVVALLKRWLLGTHQGAVRGSHLDYYPDEFTGRFNRRFSRSRGRLLYRLVQQAVAVDPLPAKRIKGVRSKA